MGRAVVFLFVSSFVVSFCKFPWGASTLSWDRPGRRAKGSLQRAATARTADRKTGQNVRRHDLDRSDSSMIKQKKLGLFGRVASWDNSTRRFNRLDFYF